MKTSDFKQAVVDTPNYVAVFAIINAKNVPDWLQPYASPGDELIWRPWENSFYHVASRKLIDVAPSYVKFVEYRQI